MCYACYVPSTHGVYPHLILFSLLSLLDATTSSSSSTSQHPPITTITTAPSHSSSSQSRRKEVIHKARLTQAAKLQEVIVYIIRDMEINSHFLFQ